MNTVVATVGMPGSGKSEVVKFFEDKNFHKVYFGGITLEQLQKEGLEVNEVNEKMMRERLRQEHGMAAYAKLALPKIEAALKEGNVIIDGLYSWEEYLVLKEKFPQMQVVAVYAPFNERARRLGIRKVRPLTPEEVQSRDYSQIENLHTAGPIVMADCLIVNTGSTKDLITKLEEFLNA